MVQREAAATRTEVTRTGRSVAVTNSVRTRSPARSRPWRWSTRRSCGNVGGPAWDGVSQVLKPIACRTRRRPLGEEPEKIRD